MRTIPQSRIPPDANRSDRTLFTLAIAAFLVYAALFIYRTSFVVAGERYCERVTVTLSAELVEGIDRLERNRSRFIAEAVEHELAKRRREDLLSSVRNPHPETVDLADAGLKDWTELPDDEGLVNLTGGTAIRWVEGQGWMKDSA
jgi:hypothetical protein